MFLLPNEVGHLKKYVQFKLGNHVSPQHVEEKSPKVVEKQPPIWRIIPISTWLITLVSSSPQKKGLFSFQMTLWPVNAGYLITITNWDDAEGTKPVSAAQGGPKYFTMVKYPTESLLWTIMEKNWKNPK